MSYYNQPGYSYPPPQQGYPPQQQGYQPQQYPSQQQGYPPPGFPPQQGYAPAQGYHPQQGYPPPQQGYVPNQNYPPQQQNFAYQNAQQQNPQQHGQNPPGFPFYENQNNKQAPQQYDQQETDQLKKKHGNGSIQLGQALQVLDSLPAIYIKQKFEWLEDVCGLETPNSYKVYAANKNGDKTGTYPLFRCKEQSSFCTRICCPGNLRPFKMKCHLYQDNSSKQNVDLYKDDKIQVFMMDRPYQCTFLCLNRPYINVVYTENGAGKFLGKIVMPFGICSLAYNLYDQNNSLKYVIQASICQLGMLCKLPCKACQTVYFDILDTSKQVVSKLVKESVGCFKACVGDSDNFRVIFPQGSSKEDKALILAATLLIDYTMFETNPNEEQ